MRHSSDFIARSTTIAAIVMAALISKMEFAAEKQELQMENIPLVTKQQTIHGSRLRGEQKKSIRGAFQLDLKASTREGFAEAGQAVMAFYEANEHAYQQTDADHELTALLVLSTQNRYYVTNAVKVPSTFSLRATVQLPLGWKTRDAVHTHPATVNSQEGFSIEDRKAVLKGLPGYYVRTPLGDVRFLNKELARSTRRSSGAAGKSICPVSQVCISVHHKKV